MKKDSVKKGSKVKAFPRVVVKRSFSGMGIFAMEEIKKGTKILQYFGPIVSAKEADENPNRYIFEINEQWSIDGSPLYNTARYFNHSCKPNAESVLEVPNRIFISAKKKILPGEEITFDYGKEYINDYIKKGGCKCSLCIRVS